MLTITDDQAHNAILVEPLGALSRADFAALTARFDDRVNAEDQIPNLVIHAPNFPGWQDFGALVGHLDFIRAHQRLIAKIALVSDSRVLDIAPRIARHFVVAEIRHFPTQDLAAALAWVGAADPPPNTSR